MPRIALSLLVTLALAPAALGAGWMKTVAAAQKTAKEKKQLILVDMYAEWCGWCHRFDREVFPSEAFQKATSDMVLLRLDTEDKGEGTKFARDYRVNSLPTFLILTPDLAIAGMIRGYYPPASFAEQLSDQRKFYTEFNKRVAAEASIAKDYGKRLELARELGERFDWARAESRLRKLTTEKGVPADTRDEAFYLLATQKATQARYDEALKIIREFLAIRQAGDAANRARLLAGQIYIRQGNYLAARNELRTLKQTAPNSPLIRNVDLMLPDIERRLAKGN